MFGRIKCLLGFPRFYHPKHNKLHLAQCRRCNWRGVFADSVFFPPMSLKKFLNYLDNEDYSPETLQGLLDVYD